MNNDRLKELIEQGQFNNCLGNITITGNELEEYKFTFERFNYRLLFLGKVLFRIPKIGKWLFDKGYAVECYDGVRIITNDND